MGATSGGFFFWVFLFIFFACFQMGFYFVTTGWIFEIGLCVNSINQSNPLPSENQDFGLIWFLGCAFANPIRVPSWIYGSISTEVC